MRPHRLAPLPRLAVLPLLAALPVFAASSAVAQTGELADPSGVAPSEEPAAPSWYAGAEAPVPAPEGPPPAARRVPPSTQPTYAASRQYDPGAYRYAPRDQPAYGYPPSTTIPRRHRPIVGYRTEQRNPPEIWGTGLGLLLAGWVLDFAILTPLANALGEDRSGASEQDAWAWSIIPIAGPFIQLGIEAPHPAIPILTGLLQIGGLVTFIVGLTQRETRRVDIRQGDPEDPAMLQVAFDAGPIEGGGQVTLRLTHL